MSSSSTPQIPNRSQTLSVLRLMNDRVPLLLLRNADEDDGYGGRWLIDGHPVHPAIARYLLDQGCIAETGKTEVGARILRLTEKGCRVREDGQAWWDSLSWWQRLQVVVFG